MLNGTLALARQRREQVYLIKVDVVKAFDWVWRSSMMCAISDWMDRWGSYIVGVWAVISCMMPNLYALPRPPDVKVMHGAVLAPRSTIQTVFDKNEVKNAYSLKLIEKQSMIIEFWNELKKISVRLILNRNKAFLSCDLWLSNVA